METKTTSSTSTKEQKDWIEWQRKCTLNGSNNANGHYVPPAGYVIGPDGSLILDYPACSPKR